MAEPCNAQEAELEASIFAGADLQAEFDREAGAQPSAWADEDEAAPGTGAVALWEDREGDAGARCVFHLSCICAGGHSSAFGCLVVRLLQQRHHTAQSVWTAAW